MEVGEQLHKNKTNSFSRGYKATNRRKLQQATTLVHPFLEPNPNLPNGITQWKLLAIKTPHFPNEAPMVDSYTALISHWSVPIAAPTVPAGCAAYSLCAPPVAPGAPAP